MLNCMSFIGMSEREEKHIFNASIDQKKKNIKTKHVNLIASYVAQTFNSQITR